MKLKRNGATRNVLLVGRIAIKVPKVRGGWYNYLCGILANINECKTYRYALLPGSYNYDNRRFLCPVVWMSWGGFVLVMRRAEPFNKEVVRGNEYMYMEMCKCVDVFPGDDKDENYGILDGAVVKIDYGQLG